MYSKQDLKNAAEFRDEIHKAALAKVRAVYPTEAYFQEVWDYPGKWYTIVGTPPGAGNKNALINTIVRETLAYYRNTGAAYTDDAFYRMIAEYPDIVCNYCLVDGI